jgi:hypothetical protein
VLGGGEEVEHDVAVGEVAHHRLVLRGDLADRRDERGRLQAVGLGQGGRAVERRAERLGARVLLDVRRGGVDDPQRVRLGILAGVAPRGDAVAAEDAADRIGVLCLDLGDVEAELEARTAQGTQTTFPPKIVWVSSSPSAEVAIAMPESG